MFIVYLDNIIKFPIIWEYSIIAFLFIYTLNNFIYTLNNFIFTLKNNICVLKDIFHKLSYFVNLLYEIISIKCIYLILIVNPAIWQVCPEIPNIDF